MRAESNKLLVTSHVCTYIYVHHVKVLCNFLKMPSRFCWSLSLWHGVSLDCRWRRQIASRYGM